MDSWEWIGFKLIKNRELYWTSFWIWSYTSQLLHSCKKWEFFAKLKFKSFEKIEKKYSIELWSLSANFESTNFWMTITFKNHFKKSSKITIKEENHDYLFNDAVNCHYKYRWNWHDNSYVIIWKKNVMIIHQLYWMSMSLSIDHDEEIIFFIYNVAYVAIFHNYYPLEKIYYFLEGVTLMNNNL